VAVSSTSAEIVQLEVLSDYVVLTCVGLAGMLLSSKVSGCCEKLSEPIVSMLMLTMFVQLERIYHVGLHVSLVLYRPRFRSLDALRRLLLLLIRRYGDLYVEQRRSVLDCC